MTPYYRFEDFRSIPKIDAHVHIRAHLLDFAEQAARDNFRLVNIVTDKTNEWPFIHEQHAYALTQHQAAPHQLKMITSFATAGFHESGWEDRVISWLDSCFAQGAIGVKIWKNIGMTLQDTNGSYIMVDDPRLDKIFSHVAQQGKILIGHLGEPKNCWLPLEDMTTNNNRDYFKNHPEYHMYLHPEMPSYQDQMQARDRRLDKHPDLKFVGAHMASLEWSVDTLGAWLDRYPNTTVDLAARMSNLFYQAQGDREKVRQFFLSYTDRLLYGTDLIERGNQPPQQLIERMRNTWLRDWAFLATDSTMESRLVTGSFQGLHLPREVIDKIYFDNAKTVFGF